MNLATLGDRLRNEREKKGWTQLYIAEKTGISNANISNYEMDKRVPDLNTLGQLAQFYEVSTDYLIYGQTLGRDMDELDKEIVELSYDMNDEQKRFAIEVLKRMK